MNKRAGWRVTGYKLVRGEEATCKVGTYQTYLEASGEADIWITANGRSAIEAHIDPVYEEMADNEGWE